MSPGGTADPTVDVVVVGAGLAGLVAARDLSAAGRSVLVLEARDRVGGRVHGVEVPGVPGVVLEAGGQWVGPTQDRVLGLLGELGLSTFPTHGQGRHLVSWRGRVRTYRGRVPRLDPVTVLDVGQTQLALERASRRLRPEAPWEGATAARLDAETFGTWLRRHARTTGGRRFFQVLTQAVFSAEPEELSALWVAAYVRAAGGLDALVATAGGAQQDRVVGGSHLIAGRLADALGDQVRLSCPVRALHRDARGVTARTDAGSVRARRAVVAVPPALAAALDYDPPLPADRTALLQRMPMGAVIKVNVVYDEPFWRAAGLSGQAASGDHPVAVVYDNSPPSGRPGVLLVFLEGRHAVTARALTVEQRRELVLAGLVRLFGPRAAHPTVVLEQDWSAEPWSRGAYGAFTTPGALVRFGPALRRPVGPLHWAGAETAVRWTGYMDGAVESGARAAAEVLAAWP